MMTMYNQQSPGPVGPRGQTKSVAAILAIVCAISTLFIAHNAMLRLLLAVGGVLLGLVGVMRALSPRVSGGILSLLAILISLLGLLLAIIDALT